MNATDLYGSVIQDVMKTLLDKCQKEEERELLIQLQALWESKLMNSGVMDTSITFFASNGFEPNNNNICRPPSISNYSTALTPFKLSNLPTMRSPLNPRPRVHRFTAPRKRDQTSTREKNTPPKFQPLLSSSLLDGKPLPFLPQPKVKKEKWFSIESLRPTKLRKKGKNKGSTETKQETVQSEIPQVDGLDDIQSEANNESNEMNSIVNNEEILQHKRQLVEADENLDSDLEDKEEEIETENLILCQYEEIKWMEHQKEAL